MVSAYRQFCVRGGRNGMVMIELTNVTKRFVADGPPAVDAVSLSVAAGEFVVLLGESGSGKTTTCKMINRLVDATSGTITVDGDDIQSLDPVMLRRRIGYVFQGIGLFPHWTVGRNIAAVPSLLGWDADDTAARVDELLEMVHLPPDEYRDRRPTQLSGGQRQRVGVARALAARPKIMLMDEPFGALDPITRDNMQEEYRTLHRELGLTTVMVTHDMTEALLLADRIAVMKDGRVLQLATPHELLTSPADDYVKTLFDTPRKQAEQVEALVS